MSKLILLIVSTIVGSTVCFIPCEDPSASVGTWVSSKYAEEHGLGKECAALVQKNCLRQPGNQQIGLTAKWRKGIKVKENCEKIPKLTAIATFLGPNDSYKEPHLHQHTAIFMKCETNGIRVWDQWKAQPLDSRIIPWTGHTIQYSGNNFWTIAD